VRADDVGEQEEEESLGERSLWENACFGRSLLWSNGDGGMERRKRMCAYSTKV